MAKCRRTHCLVFGALRASEVTWRWGEFESRTAYNHRSWLIIALIFSREVLCACTFPLSSIPDSENNRGTVSALFHEIGQGTGCGRSAVEDPPGIRPEPSRRNLRPRQQALAKPKGKSSAAEPFEQQLFWGVSRSHARWGDLKSKCKACWKTGVCVCVCVRGDGKHAYP